MKLSRIFLFSFLFLLSACGNSSQDSNSEAIVSEPTATKDPVDLEKKSHIKKSVEAYIEYNCTPKYFTEVDDLGDGVVTRIKQMDVYDNETYLNQASVTDAIPAEYFLSKDVSDSSYGNFAVRTLYLTFAYHSKLSGLYSAIYDIHSSQLRELRKDYTRFRVMADTASRKICSIAKQNLENENLVLSDIEKIQPVFDQLEANWAGFNSWLDAANQLEENVSNNIASEMKESMTPKCNEYPSADGKYVIVKCSVPQG